MGKVVVMSVEDTKKVIGGSIWSKLGQMVRGGITRDRIVFLLGAGFDA